MPKFQVVKCQAMRSQPGSKSNWEATMVKGLYTDDGGEVEMIEVMLFGERGFAPPTFDAGQTLAPHFVVRRNKTNGRMEFVIGSLTALAAASLAKAA